VFKQVVLRIGLIGMIAVMAGCVDLFSVPGFALSPDGSSIVFLSGYASLNIGDREEAEDSTFNLARADLASGQTTVIAAGDDKTSITAFAVSPTNGDVAYVTTNEESGTSLMLAAADGSSRELLGAADFSGISIGTMMQFSPDGSKLAYTLIQLPPGITLDSVDDDEEPDPEVLKQIKFVAYVFDLTTGQATAISNPDIERANTIAWSPAGDKIAYNAWVDGNDDGVISTMPSMDSSATTVDVSRISVYNLGAGSSTPVDDPNINYAPAFLSNDRLAFVSILTSSTAGGSGGLKAVDLNTGVVSLAYTPSSDESLLGIAVSRDGSQVAWIESSSETTSGDTESEEPSSVYVSGPDFAEPRKVADLPVDMLLPDVPIWTADGSAVLVSVTNPLSTLPAQISMSFSMEMDSEGVEATAEADAETSGSIGKVVRVDIVAGTVTEVFTAPMINSSFFSSLFSLAASGSDMEGMSGDS
jgi:Tol biopolymer transport system component